MKTIAQINSLIKECQDSIKKIEETKPVKRAKVNKEKKRIQFLSDVRIVLDSGLSEENLNKQLALKEKQKEGLYALRENYEKYRKVMVNGNLKFSPEYYDVTKEIKQADQYIKDLKFILEY